MRGQVPLAAFSSPNIRHSQWEGREKVFSSSPVAMLSHVGMKRETKGAAQHAAVVSLVLPRMFPLSHIFSSSAFFIHRMNTRGCVQTPQAPRFKQL